jgi:hypothetical protein
MVTLKHFNKNILWLIPLVLFSLSTNSMSAASSPANQTTNKAQTKIKRIKIASIVASPNSCALEPLEEVCEMTFHLLWETPKKGNYCLYLADEFDTPIKCWKKTERASIQLTYFAHILENSKNYLLIDNSPQTIAVVVVPVTGTLKQRQRAQRRRRGFWRMF